MAFKLLPLVLLSLLFAEDALAAPRRGRNDWQKPCRGECYYDLPSKGKDSGEIESSGTLKIWSASGAIADITTAAGWEVLNCDPKSNDQDIRLVCTGKDSDCDELFGGFGAVDKIVRLPENCGSTAFAHISRAADADDQSVPEAVAKRLLKRQRPRGKVRTIHIDTNYGAVDVKKTGVVKFALLGATIDGADASAVEFPSDTTKRGLKTGFVGESISAVRSLHEDSQALDKRLFHVEIERTYKLPPFDISRSLTLIDKTMTCSAITAHLKVEVGATAHADVTVGFAAEGEVIPPRVDDFAVWATLNAWVAGSVDVTADVTGSVTAAETKLVEITAGTFGFSGILTIGPSFRVDARASANMNLNAQVHAGIAYTVENATLVFPPTTGLVQRQDAAFKIGDTALTLKVIPTANANGNVEAHLIPSVRFGVDALGGAAYAGVFLKVDASAMANMNLAASVTRRSDVPPAIRGSGPMGVKEVRAEERRDDLEKRAVAFNGCVDIDAGLDVMAGASANFFNLFSPSTEVVLYSKDFAVYDKCFGNGVQRRSIAPPVEHQLERRLACPATLSDAPVTLVGHSIHCYDIVAS